VKNFRRFAATLVVAISILAIGVETSYAYDFSFLKIVNSVDSESELQDYLLDYWRKSTSTSYPVSSTGIEVSYSELQTLCVSLNEAGFPCEIKYVSDLLSGGACYVVSGIGAIVLDELIGIDVYDISGRIHTNSVGRPYFSRVKADLEIDPDADYGDQVLMWLHNIYDYVSTISHSLTDTEGPFYLWMKKFDIQYDLMNINLETIDLHLQQIFENISLTNIDLEIINLTLEDLIKAVEGISIGADGSVFQFDTEPITNKLVDVNESVERFHYDFNGYVTQFGESLEYSKGMIDSIERLHYDFDNYFSQFGDLIDYGEVEYVLEGQQQIEWDNNSYSYISGELTPGSAVIVSRIPEIYSGSGSPVDIYVRHANGTPEICTDSSLGLPGSFYLSYDGHRQSVNLSSVEGSGYRSGMNFWITNGVPGGDISFEFYGKTVQDGTPTESAPVPLRNVGAGSEVISAELSNEEGFSHTVYAALPDGGLAGIPVSEGGNYTDSNGQAWIADVVYDGECYVQWVKTVTFDGSADEGWFNNYGSTDNYYFGCKIGDYGEVLDGVIISDRYSPATVNSSTTDKGIYIYNSASGGEARITVRGDNEFASAAALKKWISENPITVSFALARPIIHDLSIPPEYMGSVTGTLYAGHTWVESDSYISVKYPTANPIVSLCRSGTGASDRWYARYLDGSEVDFNLTSENKALFSVLDEAFSVRKYTATNEIDSIVFHNGMNSVYVRDGTLTMTVLRGNKFVNWFVNWQHSSRDWLDQKLDSLQITSGSGSDLTPVISRMDTIIENLGAEVGVAGCEHVYVSEINQEQTCTLPGLQTFICQSCGSSYSEILSSLGHDWLCTGHVDDELDPETGEVISAGYDVYTCSRCESSYNDYEGSGAPAEESSSIAGIISRVFEKLGSLVGELLSMGIRMLDRLLSGFDEIITSFNEKTEQIINFGSGYTAWLSGFWEIIPADLMLAWGFCLVVICVGIIGKKLFFTS